MATILIVPRSARLEAQAPPTAATTPKWSVPPQPNPRTIPDAERRTSCRKYEGRYISHYSDVYKVENCFRRKVTSAEFLFQITRAGTKIEEVPSSAMAAIPVGQELELGNIANQRSCGTLQGKLVTHSYSDVYLIEKCQRRLFTDWATLQEYQRQRGQAGAVVSSVTQDELAAIPAGADMASVVDRDIQRLQSKDSPTEVIPVDEACQGLEGQIASFQSRIYRIEKCHKREFDSQKYTQNLSYRGAKITELSATQWISLPDGKPMVSQ